VRAGAVPFAPLILSFQLRVGPGGRELGQTDHRRRRNDTFTGAPARDHQAPTELYIAYRSKDARVKQLNPTLKRPTRRVMNVAFFAQCACSGRIAETGVFVAANSPAYKIGGRCTDRDKRYWRTDSTDWAEHREDIE
jgi:hypothetical protein